MESIRVVHQNQHEAPNQTAECSLSCSEFCCDVLALVRNTKELIFGFVSGSNLSTITNQLENHE